MKAHGSTIMNRVIKTSKRVTLQYRVVAVGYNRRGKIIGITTNRPRLQTRGHHAEELLMFSMPKSLSKIKIARVNARGQLNPIHPCAHCARLADKLGITIEQL